MFILSVVNLTEMGVSTLVLKVQMSLTVVATRDSNSKSTIDHVGTSMSADQDGLKMKNKFYFHAGG